MSSTSTSIPTSTPSSTGGGYVPSIALYNPNGVVSIIAFILWGVLAGALWTRYFKTRPRPKWMLCLVLGSSFMSLGFIIRFTRRNQINAWGWIFETLCILLSPCAFLAQDYILLPRIATHLEADDCLWIKRTWLVKLFVTGDIVTFVAQLGGIALMASTQFLANIGSKITLGGLAVQAASFVTFIALFITFGKRMSSRRVHYSKWQFAPVFPLNAASRKHTKTLYYTVALSCACASIRSIYRVAEYAAGARSAFANMEVFFYLFDTLPLFFSVVALTYIWPPQVLATGGLL